MSRNERRAAIGSVAEKGEDRASSAAAPAFALSDQSGAESGLGEGVRLRCRGQYKSAISRNQCNVSIREPSGICL